MPTLVGSVSVRQLEDADITDHDVRNCCQIQFGNELSFQHSDLMGEVHFYAERPERIFNRPDTIQSLRLIGGRGTVPVALTYPSQLYPYLPEPKVVPTRNKKLLLT